MKNDSSSAMSPAVTEGRPNPSFGTGIVVKPSDREKAINVQNRMRDMLTNREQYSNQWDENLDSYLMTEETGKEDWQAKGQSSLLYGITEGVFAELLDVTPDAELVPLSPEIPPAIVAQLNRLMHLPVLQRENNLHILYALKEATLNGTGIVEVGYACEERPYKFMVPKMDAMGMPTYDKRGKMQYEYKEEVVTVKDEIQLRRVPINRFLIDPYATSVDEADDCIVLEWYGFEQFKRKFGNQDFYKNVEKVKPMNRTTTSPTYGAGSIDPKLQRMMIPGVKDYVHVIRYFNKADEFVVMANNVLIRSTPNPYSDKRLPFVNFRFNIVNDRFYGMGLGEAMRSEQKHLSTMLRIAIDQSKIASTPPTFMSQQMGIDDDQLMLRPGKIIHLDGDVGQSQVMNVADISNSLYRVFEKLDEESRMASGFDTRLLQGAGSATTAYEYGIRRELQMKRLAAAVKMFEKEGMQPLMEMVLSRLQQFYSFERVYRGFNGEPQKVVAFPTIIAPLGDGTVERTTITQELATALRQEWRVIARSTAEIGKSKVAERSNAMEMLQTLSSMTIDPNAPHGEDPRILSVKRLVQEFSKKVGIDYATIAPEGEWTPPQPEMPDAEPKMNMNVRADLSKMPTDVQEAAMKKLLGDDLQPGGEQMPEGMPDGVDMGGMMQQAPSEQPLSPEQYASTQAPAAPGI